MNGTMKQWGVLGLGVAVLGLGACDTVKAPDTIRGDPLTLGAYPQQVVLEGLNRGVVSGDPIIEKATGSRPLQVSVPLRSTVDKELSVQYRFQFFDDKGKPVRYNDSSGWRFVTIAPRTQVFVEAGALDNDAADWRLEVRPAK